MGSANTCHISINRSVCVDRQEELKDIVFVEKAKAVLARDQNTCRLCGFQASKMQQVITMNGYYSKEQYTEKNLITVCPCCYVGQRLGYAALDNKVTFVYCPELSQADLNHLQRLIYHYANIETGEYDQYDPNLPDDIEAINNFKDICDAILMELRERAQLVPKMFDHSSLSHIKPLTSMLFELNQDRYDLRGKFFRDVRYLVTPKLMNSLNDIYKDTCFRTLTGLPELEKSKILKTFDSGDR